jgi:hypothetical protein
MHEYQELINSGAYSGFAHQSSTSNGYLPSPKTALDIASGLSNFLKENIPSYEYSIPSAFSDSWVTRNPFIVSTKTGIYKTIDSGAYQYYTSNDFSGFFSGKSELIAGDIFYGDFDGACNGLYSGSIISGSIQTKDSNFTSGFFRSYSGSFYGFTGNNGLFSTGIDSGIYSGNFTGSFIGYATGTFSFFNGSGDANYYGNFKSGFLRSFSIYDGKTTGSFFSGMVDNGSGYFNGYNEYLLRTGCSFSEVKENNLFEISGYFSSASYGSSGLYRGELFTGIYFSGSLVSGKHILSNDSVGFLKNYSGFVSGATGVNFAFTGDISEFIGDVSGYISGYDFDFSGKLFDFKLASSIFSGEFSGGGFGNFIYQSGIEYSISQTGFLADGWGFFKNGFVEISGFGYEKPPSINNFYITKSNNYINWQNVKIDNSSYDPSSDSYDPYNDNISCFVWNIVDREKSKALRGRKVIGCAEISCLPNGFSLTNLHCGIMFVYSEKLEDVYTNMSSNFINRISCDAIRFSYNAGGWGEYGSDNQGKFKSRYFPSNYQYGYDETWSLQYQKSGDYKKIIPLSGLFVTPECIVPNDCNQIRFYIGSFAYPHHITSGEFMFRKAGVYTVDHNG